MVTGLQTDRQTDTVTDSETNGQTSDVSKASKASYKDYVNFWKALLQSEKIKVSAKRNSFVVVSSHVVQYLA